MFLAAALISLNYVFMTWLFVMSNKLQLELTKVKGCCTILIVHFSLICCLAKVSEFNTWLQQYVYKHSLKQFQSMFLLNGLEEN